MAKKPKIPANYGPYVRPIDAPALPTEAKKKPMKMPKTPKKGGYC